MVNSTPPWRLADLVDYETFLASDEHEAPETLRTRDREIQARILPGSELADGDRRGALRLWLEERRRITRAAVPRGQEVVLAGDAFSQISAFLRVVLAITGLLLGGGAAWVALIYTRGGEPINALAFFCEFAGLQVLILAGACLAFGLRRFLPELPSLARLLWRVAAAGAGKLWHRAGARLSGTTRTELRGHWGTLTARRGLYGRVVPWRLLRLTQIFAIAFNFGVLGAMTGRGFSQLYFGWEATYQWVTAPVVHRVVATAAAPWRWLGVAPGPSLEAVERSQNVRREGSAPPDRATAADWNAFLLAAVVFYGLLPRVVLLAIAGVGERWMLRRLRFTAAQSEALWLRLQTPALTVASQPSRAAATHPPVAPRAEPAATPVESAAHPVAVDGSPRLVFNLTGVPLESADVAAAFGPAVPPIAAVLPAGSLDPAEDERSFAEATAQLAENPALRPVALLGAWTPPMRATHLLLDRIRRAAGPERIVELALVGKPRPAPVLTGSGPTEAGAGGGAVAFRPVEPAHRDLWASAARSRGDAYLSFPAA